MHREEALGILGLAPSEAKNFAAVRTAYHRRMWAVHPDLNPDPHASEAAARVSAAYDLLDRAYRAQRAARMTRDAAAARSRSPGHNGANGSGARARVLNDTTVTSMGSTADVFTLARRAGELIGEVSSTDTSAGVILVVAEFLHMPPCQVTLTVMKRGADRAHVRCSVESLSSGDAPPVAAVTRLVAQKMVEAEQSHSAAAATAGSA